MLRIHRGTLAVLVLAFFGLLATSAAGEEQDSFYVVVKLKTSDGGRPTHETLDLTTERARAFRERYGLSGRAVHEAHRILERSRRVSERGLAAEVRRRFPRRAARRRGRFAPPALSETYSFRAPVSSRAELSAIIRRLREDPDVEFAEEDKRVEASFVPDDPYYNLYGSWGQAYDDLYGLKKMGVELAWEDAQGAGVVVAVVDTGVDVAHPDIASNIWINADEIPGNGIDDDANGFVDDVVGWDFVGASYSSAAEDADPSDGHGHGTHVAGTIAAVANNGIGVVGVAFASKVMVVKGLDDSGTGLDSQLASAIVYAADNGADVINASWGARGASAAISDAIDYATSLGVVFVAAAGNSAADVKDFYPAALPNVITVAATDQNDELASFSNWGSRIDVAAPGVDILSLRAQGTNLGTALDEQYTRLQGTSMAAPHVSGLAALILSRYESYSTEQVRQAIRQSATDLGEPGVDLNFGYGRVDAASAVTFDTALEARIFDPAPGGGVTGNVELHGLAQGAGFSSFALAWGAGETPASWTTFYEGFAPVNGGALGTLDASTLSDGLYVVRLTVLDTTGRTYIDQLPVVVDGARITAPTPPLVPAAAIAVRPGARIPIEGRASGESFVGFHVEWARGIYPTSGWSDSGVTLEGQGSTPVEQGLLATWDTSGITVADYYSIRLVVEDAVTRESYSFVYLEPNLASPHWPHRLAPGQWPYTTPQPVLSSMGQPEIVATTQINGAAKLWRISGDGSSLRSEDIAPGSAYQWISADLDGEPGDETVLSQSSRLEVLRADGTSYSLPSVSPFSLARAVAVAEDLRDDAAPEILAVATYFPDGAGRLMAWHADGTPLGGAFPIPIDDKNTVLNNGGVTRLLVADLDGDGSREIVVAVGPTSTSFGLRVFNADGSERAWADPTFETTLHQLAAADLDGDGQLEILVLLRTPSSDRVVHVLRADGTPLPGWPVTVRLSQPYLAVADLDLDGRNEVIVSSGYDLNVLRYDGTPFSPVWPRRIDARYFGPPAVADIDGDGTPEIVVAGFRNAWYTPQPIPVEPGGRPSHGSVPYTDYRLLVVRPDGQVGDSWQLQGTGTQNLIGLVTPVIADVDGDGTTDVALNAMVVEDGKAFVEDSLLTVISTGGAFRASVNSWPMIMHDGRNASVLPADRMAPSVSITTPSEGAILTGVTTVAASASDNVAVKGVQFQVDGVDFGDEDRVEPFELDLDPYLIGNGPHVLTAVARDASGLRTLSAPVGVMVDLDLTPPFAILTSPGPGAILSEPLTVLAEATDQTGVTHVELYVDGELRGTDVDEPFTFPLDPASLSDGSHSLAVQAYDPGGNVGSSDPVDVTVSVPPVVEITSPSGAGVLTGTVEVSAVASDNSGVVRVDFFANGEPIGSDEASPWAVAWNTLAAVEGSYALTALAHDAAGNSASSDPVSVDVDHPPVVLIVSPAAGAVLAGPVTVLASAGDAGGIERVELHVDGVLQATDTEPPYELPWDASVFVDGAHSLVARAFDLKGHVGESVAVAVTVAVPPQLVLTAPEPGAALSGISTVSFDAFDNTGVVRVELYVDGSLAATDTSLPFRFDIDTSELADGPHSLHGRAYDAAGLTGESADVSVTTENGLAIYDPALQVPACAEVGALCDSGILLKGRADKGPEPNYPNTLSGTCADGTGGRYQIDESNERIRISTADGSPFAPGTTVNVQVTVWAYSGYTSDKLDLYYAANALAPQWSYLTTITPPGKGEQTMTASYTLPIGGTLQAVRARFRYGGSPVACGAGTYNDHDDLAFAVEPPVDAGPPVVSITSPAPGATLSSASPVTVEATDDLGVAVVELYASGTLVGSDADAPYVFNWDPSSVADGEHDLLARARDVVGNEGESAPVPVIVSIPPVVSITFPTAGAVLTGVVDVTAEATDNGTVDRVELYVDDVLRFVDHDEPYQFAWDTGEESVGLHTLRVSAFDAAGLRSESPEREVDIQAGGVLGEASYDPVLRAPRCALAHSFCDSGTLLVGRASLGPEPNAPNTIGGACTDGLYGRFHADESSDHVRVSTLDGGSMAAGKTVRVDVTVWAYSSYASDKLDLYYTANAEAATPVWTWIGTFTPTAAGAGVLSATYTLPTGHVQAVRARFRYGGSATPCGSGSFNDHDDLVFSVQ